MLWKNSALYSNNRRFVSLQSGSLKDLRVNYWRRVIFKRRFGWWWGFRHCICFLLLLNELLHNFKIDSASLGSLAFDLVNDLFIFIIESWHLEWRDWGLGSFSIFNWAIISCCLLLFLVLNDGNYEEIRIICRLLLWFILSLNVTITNRSVIEVVYIIVGSLCNLLRLDSDLKNFLGLIIIILFLIMCLEIFFVS